jgi:pyruvate/2-oxoglutarate dehydrogenase complex dihydrolipoamide dehydrogenase (E3) component
MMKFDLAVIGSGPGGFAATMRAVDFGKNVCLIEAGHTGGTGIMNGPLTSKTMWELSVDYSIAAAVDRGIQGFRIAGRLQSGEENSYRCSKNQTISDVVAN